MNITWPEAPHAVILRQLETHSGLAVLALDFNDWKPMGSSAFSWDGDDALVYLGIGVAMLLLVMMVVFQWYLLCCGKCNGGKQLPPEEAPAVVARL